MQALKRVIILYGAPFVVGTVVDSAVQTYKLVSINDTRFKNDSRENRRLTSTDINGIGTQVGNLILASAKCNALWPFTVPVRLYLPKTHPPSKDEI